jgi:hypothetical protein
MYTLFPFKTAEYDLWVTICVDLEGPFTIHTPLRTHPLLALITIVLSNGRFENADASRLIPSRIYFMTSGGHVTQILFLLYLTIRANSNQSSRYCINYVALKKYDLGRENLDEDNHYDSFIISPTWANMKCVPHNNTD